MRTISIEGKEVEAFELEPLRADERWNEYLMSNGDLLRVKLVITRVFQARDTKNKAGENIYSIDFQPVMRVVGGKE